MKHFVTVSVCVFSLVCNGNANTIEGLSNGMASIEAMEHIFYRSDETRANSMAAIMRTMTVAKAARVLKEHHLNTPGLAQATRLALGKVSSLRQSPTGYSSLDGAKKLLNDMIFTGSSKYDVEIASCTDFYTKQCASMELCRADIAAANTICANSRGLILHSQACMERAETDIVNGKQKLKFHLLQCQHELYKMKSRLKILAGDLEVLTAILRMTDCDSSFVQRDHLELLKCEDPCNKNTFFTFSHDALKKKMSQLQASVSHDLIHESFNSLFVGIDGLKTAELLQSVGEYIPVVNKTRWSNKPVPRTEMPADPCNDPNGGAPSLNDKRAAKCTITQSPVCYKLQERFILIQSGVQDEHDELLEEIDLMEHYCEETKTTLQTQIADDESLHSNCQTKLAEATEKEAVAGEKGRTVALEHDQLEGEMKKKMKSCSTNYINFETEICALKKIRGELYKMKGGGSSTSFQDCVVSKWSPLECSASCGGGTQLLQRSVMIHPNGGAGCLPLQMEKTCNAKPCPVDCVLETWDGWSKCSAECGGGLKQRLREVVRDMKFDGKPCSATSEAVTCNAQACEKDCELTDWTAWSTCSKDCDGGTMKREKFVKNAAEGAGKCADEWSRDRLEYKQCNNIVCDVNLTASKSLTCDKSMDIVLLIDGSGSLGAQGWNAEIKAANAFVDAFIDGGADTQISVILFSGPRTWGGVSKCTGKRSVPVDIQNVCQIKTISHLSSDLKNVKSLISGMKWPMGSTLTSVALMTAKSELTLGRKDSHANIIVFTDGRPLSYRKTELASREVRKSARLIWVPVTKYAPLAKIKLWATRRWEENVVAVNNFGDLEKPEVVTQLIANICPKNPPHVDFIPGTQQAYR